MLTDEQRRALTALLDNGRHKSDLSFRQPWTYASEAVCEAASEAARSALSELRMQKRFPVFHTLADPSSQTHSPSSQIPQLAFVTTKVTKSLEKYLQPSGMNQSHGPDWAAEVLALDENYRLSAPPSSHRRLAVFNDTVIYRSLSETERDSVSVHLRFQINPTLL